MPFRVFIIYVLFYLLGCSPKSDAPKLTKGEEKNAEEKPDQPVNITGMYLSCSFLQEPNEDVVSEELGCALRDKQTGLKNQDTLWHWDYDKNSVAGAQVTSRLTATDPTWHAIFGFAANSQEDALHIAKRAKVMATPEKGNATDTISATVEAAETAKPDQIAPPTVDPSLFVEPKEHFTEPKINEFVFNHTGDDSHEYIEILGSPLTDYKGYSILVVEGDINQSYIGRISFFAALGKTDENGYFVTSFMHNKLPNGTQTLLLVEGLNTSSDLVIDAYLDGQIDSWPADKKVFNRVVDEVAVHDGGVNDLTYSKTLLLPNFDEGTILADGEIHPVGGASRKFNRQDLDTAQDWLRNDFFGYKIPCAQCGTNALSTKQFCSNTPGKRNCTP